MKFVARIKSAWKTRRSTQKCGECNLRELREDMHRVQLEKEYRLPLPLLIVRNLFLWIMGYKPDNVRKRAWLFGHGFMGLQTRKVMRWVCVDCYIRLLTPEEYESFRNAFYDDLLDVDGQDRASQRIAHMDEVFAAREAVS